MEKIMENTNKVVGRELTEEEINLITGGSDSEDYDGDNRDDTPMDIHKD